MEVYPLFETYIVTDQCAIDNSALLMQSYAHAKQVPSETLSNAGGYQGHNFYSGVIFDEIRKKVPQRSDRPIQSFDIQAWVNINQENSWNDIHSHQDDGVFLSGIYYVQARPGCGNIRLYDPRFSMGMNLYNKYYAEGKGNYVSFLPGEGMLLFFPPWLHHMVEPNQSDSDRISIAFNLINPVF